MTKEVYQTVDTPISIQEAVEDLYPVLRNEWGNDFDMLNKSDISWGYLFDSDEEFEEFRQALIEKNNVEHASRYAEMESYLSDRSGILDFLNRAISYSEDLYSEFGNISPNEILDVIVRNASK